MSGNGNGENGVGSSSTASSDVHPIELTVQSLIDSPLQILNLNLQSLYESQVILSSTLKKVQKLLGNSNNGLNNLSSLIHIENDEYDENDNDDYGIRHNVNKRHNRDNTSSGSGGNGNISGEDASSDAATIGNSPSVDGVGVRDHDDDDEGTDGDGGFGKDINGSGSEDGFCTLQNVDTRTYQERVSYLREEMILITNILKKVENRVDKIVSQLE
ncbi:unnamed protein product [[Candida] boidinii]|nr:hypothetical protein BVG19_g2596 [[Candida] boidinii]OWB48619.1 hypothetical protein B5S27_g154 [[Candida] boidinii]OWB86330.1 hypothetical protein B5S33_g5016 [[Candida] boidinii]GMF60779.1 unnamed protein product [[Candida] boidinii]